MIRYLIVEPSATRSLVLNAHNPEHAVVKFLKEHPLPEETRTVQVTDWRQGPEGAARPQRFRVFAHHSVEWQVEPIQ